MVGSRPGGTVAAISASVRASWSADGFSLRGRRVDRDAVGEAGGLDGVEIGGGVVGPEQDMGAVGHGEWRLLSAMYLSCHSERSEGSGATSKGVLWTGREILRCAQRRRRIRGAVGHVERAPAWRFPLRHPDAQRTSSAASHGVLWMRRKVLRCASGRHRVPQCARFRIAGRPLPRCRCAATHQEHPAPAVIVRAFPRRGVADLVLLEDQLEEEARRGGTLDYVLRKRA